MIFQSLISLYDRLHDSGKMPDLGFSIEDIGFVITIDHQGNMLGEPEDLRRKVKTNVYTYYESTVPYSNQVNVRSSSAAKTPNFMVDKADYIFGMSGNSRKKVHQNSFRELIEDVCGDSRDEGILAAMSFLSRWDPTRSPALPDWSEMCGPHGKWVAMRLEGERRFIHERPEVRKLWQAYVAAQNYPTGVTFLDGKTHELQTQYAQFKFGSGASLVSFNEVAYESYGKKKGENAPISVMDEFKSATALKYLFRNEKQRLRIGDATTVFWTQQKSLMEEYLGIILDPAANDSGDTAEIRKFLEVVRKGKLPNDLSDDFNFYILGFSLNKARLALRFWYVCSVAELSRRLGEHFENLAMERRSERDMRYPGIWHLLKETVRDSKDISPVLGGELTRSILTGTKYPESLFQGVLGRIRADQSKRHPTTGNPIPNVNYIRASILKAILKRNHHQEVPMSLDTEKKDNAYLLGRLFAVLEKAQRDALPGINSTIKDRFFSAASATPGSVFPRLLRLSQHHIDKAEFGWQSERRIGEIMENIDEFPSHLSLQEQGLFAIAYYQQKNALWPKKESSDKGDE